ncbi:MAG: hypothetical protein QHH24_05455 [Candidatus Bathyarchaeota archaeon]|jgi:hypothetical protein|nr:hypothetical protein [Candidatus Bathyarchaeota archaeon]
MSNKKRKKGKITIKVPLKDIQKESVYDKVKAHLKINPGYGYTIGGLLVEIYGYSAEELDSPFKDWPEGAPSQYTRVRLALEKMIEEGLVDSTKQGRKFLYWWKGSQ